MDVFKICCTLFFVTVPARLISQMLHPLSSPGPGAIGTGRAGTTLTG